MAKEYGRHFVSAIAKGDIHGLKDLFTDDITFTAATPGRTWHTVGWPDTKRALQEVFPQNEKISDVGSLEFYTLPGRSSISYILRGSKENFGRFEYEHQAYYQIMDGKISRLRILCSGLYQPR